MTTATAQSLRTRSPLRIADMSRPFAAKYDGRCPLLGRRYYAGTPVRRVEFVNVDTGATFAGYLPVHGRVTELNTLRLMRWASDHEGNDRTRFIRAHKGAAEHALHALHAGYTVEAITRTGPAKTYRAQLNGKVGDLTERAWASNFTRNVVAYAITGFPKR